MEFYPSWERAMMTSSNGNIFRVTWPFVRGIYRSPEDSLTKASDAKLWCFLWSAPKQMVEQTINTPVIWDAIALIMTSLQFNLLSCILMSFHKSFYIFNRLFELKIQKLSLLALCEGNPSVTDGFPSQRANNTGFGVFSWIFSRINDPVSG